MTLEDHHLRPMAEDRLLQPTAPQVEEDGIGLPPEGGCPRLREGTEAQEEEVQAHVGAIMTTIDRVPIRGPGHGRCREGRGQRRIRQDHGHGRRRGGAEEVQEGVVDMVGVGTVLRLLREGGMGMEEVEGGGGGVQAILAIRAIVVVGVGVEGGGT